MIIHMVLFKFEDALPADFEEKVAYHCQQIRQHCQGLILFDLKENFSDRSRGFNYALSSVFKDKESLDNYQPHPVHQAFKSYLDNFPGERLVYDGDLDDHCVVTNF